MAQEVEHVLGKDEVAGSNPAISSIFEKEHAGCSFFCIKKPRKATYFAALRGFFRLLRAKPLYSPG